mmetsp:Transcript_75025/g.200121  ORF Transcript_75025/g.200121 Transcript_75025/m.200121 type:complete len:254 (-) Transcript_75025:497-1258(-)
MDLLQYPEKFVAASYSPSWMEPAAGSLLYLGCIWALKQRKGEALEILPVTVVHNLVLIVLSVLMTVGGILALSERYSQEGFDGIFCSQRGAEHVLDGAAGFWIKIYYLSKYYELGDTVLLVLKRKPTIPLHVYHHVSMLWITWSWCKFGWLEGSLWCVIVNSIIHTFMYYYYLVAALGQKVWWKKYLTSAQIFQFLTGFTYVSVFLYQFYTRGCGAQHRLIPAWISHVVNVSFIVLFAQFYRSSYTTKKSKSK